MYVCEDLLSGNAERGKGASVWCEMGGGRDCLVGRGIAWWSRGGDGGVGRRYGDECRWGSLRFGFGVWLGERTTVFIGFQTDPRR